MPSPEEIIAADLPDVKRMHDELIELRAAFLVNTTKLGTICAASGIPAQLEMSEFDAAVKERMSRLTAAQIVAEVAPLFGGNGLSTSESIIQAIAKLKAHGF